MSDLSDFKRIVYEPEIAALRERAERAEEHNRRLRQSLSAIAEGQQRKLLVSRKPNGEWTESYEVYENIARAALRDTS